MYDKNEKRFDHKTIVPIQEASDVFMMDNFLMEERKDASPPMLNRVKEAAKNVGWSGDSIAVAISDILGPHARKEWNLPVGSHKNPFWRLTRKLASPRQLNKMFSKSLILACTLGSPKLVRNMLEAGANPNPEAGMWGPIHSAAYGGNVEVMRVLLGHPDIDVNCAETKGNTALHLTAYKGNYEIMKLLLEESKIDVNAANGTGCTALHIAGTSPLLGEINANRYLRCVLLLVQIPDLKVNKPDKNGLTALSYTIMFIRKKMAKLIIKENKCHCLNVDTFLAGHYGRSIREAIQHSIPELVPDLPAPLQEDSDSDHAVNRLLASLQKGDFPTFQSLIRNKSVDVNHFYDEPYHCTIIEIASQLKNRLEYFMELLNAGVNPNAVNPTTSLSLLHQAARRGNEEIIRHLLQVKGVDVNVEDSFGRTPLHYLAQAHCKSSDECEDHQKSVSLLLGDSMPATTPISNINAVTTCGETPLHLAARVGDKETVLALLRAGADIMHRVSDIDPPLTYIDPAVIETYLDECVDSNDESPLNQDYMLVFDYQIFDRATENIMRRNRVCTSEMPLLKYLSNKHNFTHLLGHPLVSSFIMLKWRKVRVLYMMNFIFYCLFLAFLTWHSLVKAGKDIEDIVTVNKTKEVEVTESSVHEKVSIGKNRYFVANENNYSTPLFSLSILLAFLFIREIYQIFVSPIIYMKHGKNWLLWVVILSSMNAEFQIVPECQSVALLLAWTYFLVLSGDFPSLSTQSEMFKTVAGTSFKFILCYFPILFAFGLSFYTMFRKNVSEENEFFYTNFQMSMMKVFVMFSGEFEASEIPFDSAPVVSQLIFTIFVFLISIVLLNLLNGLAVSDAQSIRRNAEILSLKARVNLISYMEEMSCNRFPFFSVLTNLPDSKFRLFPNKKNGIVEVNGLHEQNKVMPPEITQEAIVIATKRKEFIVDNESGTKTESSELRSTLARMERNQMSIDDTLRAIQAQLNGVQNIHRETKKKLDELVSNSLHIK